MKKYEFTGASKTFETESRIVTVHRIRRISDGLVGGWIEKESNLSQQGECFVYDQSVVFGESEIVGQTIICHDSQVENSYILSSYVSGKSKVKDCELVRSIVKGRAEIFDVQEKNFFAIGKKYLMDFDKVEFYVNDTRSNRIVTKLHKENKTYYIIGCQHLISEYSFIDKIITDDEDELLEDNLHRYWYLDVIEGKILPKVTFYGLGFKEDECQDNLYTLEYEIRKEFENYKYDFRTYNIVGNKEFVTKKYNELEKDKDVIYLQIKENRIHQEMDKRLINYITQ